MRLDGQLHPVDHHENPLTDDASEHEGPIVTADTPSGKGYGGGGRVRLLSDPALQSAWYDAIDAEAIASCHPQRTEFLYSARGSREYDESAEMFTDLHPDVAAPKTAGRWIGSVQHRMARAGEHRSASAVDLIIAATAAHHGLTVLHDDVDYRAIAGTRPT
ncbi:VapC toxin family PIN domain ribonuclease [Streptomyces sp. NPDC059352]|uniref:VapC toxin family PIN domain ribonuclease n=1 Tax=Streptomyces sp. NPDC059352 TaxID=3346810 RepID=UPI0036A88AE3